MGLFTQQEILYKVGLKKVISGKRLKGFSKLIDLSLYHALCNKIMRFKYRVDF